MRTPATWILFFHVLAALWLAGGAFAGAVVRAHTKRAATLAEKVAGLRLSWRLTSIYTLPGAIVAGVLGFGLVTTRGHRFADGWVQASMVIYLAMIVVAIGYLAPRLRRTLAAGERAVAGGSAADFEALAAAKLPGILADVLALGIVVLTFLMVIRPGSG